MPKFLLWLLLASILVLIDQFTKIFAVRSLAENQSKYVTPFFDFYLTYNPGAAFSFLAGASGWQRWFFIFIAVFAVSYMIWWVYKVSDRALISLSLTLVIGGAIGNLVDRVFIGAVVDFISIHVGPYYWPSFNLADSFITIGALLILWETLFSKGKSDAQSLENH